MNKSAINSFRKKIESAPVDGVFMKSTDPAFVEATTHAGLDFVILDMEHGPADYKTVENLVRSTEGTNTLSIVRTPAHEAWMISKALDTGAGGVQVPNISSIAEAKQAIKAAKFFPIGQRGVCRFVRAAEYGSTEKADYFKESNDTVLVLMVEGQEGMSCIDEILDLEGIDVIFIGPYDLSQSLGIPGDIYNPIIQDHLKAIVEKANLKGIKVGTFYDDLTKKSWFHSCGISYLSYSVDVEIYRQACAEILK